MLTGHALVGVLIWNYEDKIKSAPWTLYFFSISTVLFIEVHNLCLNSNYYSFLQAMDVVNVCLATYAEIEIFR